MNPHVWWYVARATGIVAWILAVAAVLWGLALSTRATGRKPGAPWLLDLHRHLAGLTVLFVGAHVGALVADSYTHFRLVDLVVPFASSWKPGAVALGVVALWFLAAVELTSLARRRLSAKAWRSIHLTSYLAAVAATAHMVTAGSDATHPALRYGPALAVGAAAFFLTYRAVRPKRGRREPRLTTGAASP
jgi:DMSO/TMAO reductase YedYZ heme-binding membrane subunit